MSGAVVLTQKRCSSCKRQLDLSCFHKDKQTNDGLAAYCKACRKAKAASRYARPEVKAHISQQVAKYQKENAEHLREKRLAYQRAHPEIYRKGHLDWQKRNPEEAARRSRIYRALKASAPHIPYTLEQLQARLSMFPFCYLCGGEPQAVDHVKPLAKGGWDCLSNFRSICHSCNGKKKDKWPFAAVGLRYKGMES